MIFQVQDQKHERKTQGVMSGIVAAIWHLVLRSNLFYGNLYFHGPLFSGLTIVFTNSLLQGH